MTIQRPRLYLIYAIPRHQLLSENGTSRRLDSLRECFGRTYRIVDINLLANNAALIDRLATFFFLAIGLNNLRYLFLSRHLPHLPTDSNVLISGIYSAFLGLTLRDVRLSVDLVDSLSLTDVRGMQSFWRIRPLYHILQFPISFLLERLLLNRKNLKSVFVTTPAERDWLSRIHFDAPRLHVLSNSIDSLLDTTLSESESSLNCLPPQFSLAFIGSLDWWVNKRMLKAALRLLKTYLNKEDVAQVVHLHVYGEQFVDNLNREAHHPALKIIHKGYFHSAQEVYQDNHAAFLPNSIGRGFQNKLFSCLSIGLPTIAHTSMNPLGPHCWREQRARPNNPAIFCKTDADYMEALSRVFLMEAQQRLAVRQSCHQFLADWHQQTQAEYHDIVSTINCMDDSTD